MGALGCFAIPGGVLFSQCPGPFLDVHSTVNSRLFLGGGGREESGLDGRPLSFHLNFGPTPCAIFMTLASSPEITGFRIHGNGIRAEWESSVAHDILTSLPAWGSRSCCHWPKPGMVPGRQVDLSPGVVLFGSLMGKVLGLGHITVTSFQHLLQSNEVHTSADPQVYL